MSCTVQASGELARLYARALASYDGPLTPALLMGEAEDVTGLRDWGGERWGEVRFRQRLGAYCEALEREAHLTPVGRSRAHGRTHAMLISRLRTIAYRHDWTDEPVIGAPFVGTGLPRSGTSFLQALLAQDPDHLVPRTGQAMVPIPPTGVLPDERERLEVVRQMLTFQGLDAPHVNAIHPFAPDAEDEDVLFQEGACGSLVQAFFSVPSFASDLRADATDFYRWQKSLMQIVQGEKSRKRWVLKAPEYLSQLDLVLSLYPDAMLFVNHRDPAKVIASIASLYVTFQALNCERSLDPRQLGAPMLAAQMAAVRSMTHWRETHSERCIVDIHYKTLIADPIGEAERLYAAFGLRLGSAAKVRMETFLKTNRHGQKERGVAHRYSLEDFGLTEAIVEETCAEYLDRFSVARERRT